MKKEFLGLLKNLEFYVKKANFFIKVKKDKKFMKPILKEEL